LKIQKLKNRALKIYLASLGKRPGGTKIIKRNQDGPPESKPPNPDVASLFTALDLVYRSPINPSIRRGRYLGET
jgi:hypothetical protein